MKLWLARHALPLAPAGTCYGSSDIEADAQGTRTAAAALAARLPHGVPVRSSPLRRCLQLAQALVELRPDLAARPDSRLAEYDFGCWEGRPWDAIPRAEFDRWTADFAGYRFGGRDSVAALLARVRQAAGELPAEGDALWITHAGVIRAVRLLAAGGGVPRHPVGWPAGEVPFGGCECVLLVPPQAPVS